MQAHKCRYGGKLACGEGGRTHLLQPHKPAQHARTAHTSPADLNTCCAACAPGQLHSFHHDAAWPQQLHTHTARRRQLEARVQRRRRSG